MRIRISGFQFKFPHASIGRCVVFSLLLLNKCIAGDVQLFSGQEDHVETRGLVRFAMDEEVPGVEGMASEMIHDDEQGPVITAFSTISSTTLLRENLGMEGRSKLVGWFLSSWSEGKCQNGQITEQMIKEAAQVAGASRAHLLGMRYFAIDSCWLDSEHRPAMEIGENLEIKVQEAIFPSGVASLASAVKNEGLMFGLGVSASSEKCDELEPLPTGIKEMDVIRKISEWGVNFLKLNSCASNLSQAVAEFRLWNEAARTSPIRPLLLCIWTNGSPGTEARFPKVFELSRVCDIWISRETKAQSWRNLKAQVDAWVFSQQDVNNTVRHVPLFTMQKSVLSNEDAVQTQLAIAAVLGSQIVVEASNASEFSQQENFLQDDVFLAAASDQMKSNVKQRPGPGQTDVLVRQMADGDYLVALFNWESNQMDLKISHADIQNWCGLYKPVPLKVKQAWTKESTEMSSDNGKVLSYSVPSYGAMLLQIELTDSLPESQQAIIFSEHEASLWGNLGTGVSPVVDVFHTNGKPPAFTAGSRVVQRGSELESFSLRHGSKRANSRNKNATDPIDNIFKTVFSFLLPLVVASAISGDPKRREHNHRHHKRHHHNDHVHANHHIDHKHEGEIGSHKHVASTFRRSTVDSSAVKMDASTPSALVETSQQANDSSSSPSTGAVWALLTGVALLVCFALVHVWRSMFVKKFKKAPRQKEHTQLMERPHIH